MFASICLRSQCTLMQNEKVIIKKKHGSTLLSYDGFKRCLIHKHHSISQLLMLIIPLVHVTCKQICLFFGSLMYNTQLFHISNLNNLLSLLSSPGCHQKLLLRKLQQSILGLIYLLGFFQQLFAKTPVVHIALTKNLQHIYPLGVCRC